MERQGSPQEKMTLALVQIRPIDAYHRALLVPEESLRERSIEAQALGLQAAIGESTIGSVEGGPHVHSQRRATHLMPLRTALVQKFR
jgi:hypothetical protein